MAEARPNIQAIFCGALDKESPEEVAEYLNVSCGDDGDLKAQVEALLVSHREAGKFLGGPPPEVGGTVDQEIAETPGTVIGPYKLLQQIGEGGMGVVYMAEQREPVERRVAIKIIKPGMDTKQVIARFEAERQALAMMDHPNIAKVLEAGTTESGRPYFVMELVNGIPVTEYCDEQHLTARERLELFIPICQAVQHAHQKGVIHRDIKPSNILVALYDSRPVPKVIDFGVAKATSQRLTEKTMFTALGQIIGTVEYMSPEQAQRNQLDVDTRSDVYSLGVVLYELLAGDTPFDKERLRTAAFDELLRIIREEDPPRPSTRLSTSSTLPAVAANRKAEPTQLSALIRGELDWIVMKALDKDRTRRYESASSLAADVEHFLSDDPVAACPPSAAYRFRKFARRNKAAMVTAAAVSAALFVGLCGTTWQAIRATQAKKEATAAEKQATAGFKMARNAVDRLMTRVAEEQLLNTPKMEKMRGLLLTDALEFYQQIAELQSNDPSVRLDKAMALSRLGKIYGQLNDRREAENAHRDAVAQLRELHQEFPRRQECTAALADALHHYGDALRNVSFEVGASGDKELALKVHDEAILLLEELVKEYPVWAEYRLTLVETYRRRIDVVQLMERRSKNERQARRHLQRAKSLAAELVRVDGDNAKFKFAYANVLKTSASLFPEKTEEDRKAFNESIDILEGLVAQFPEVPEYRSLLAKTLWNMLNAFRSEDPRNEVKQRERVVELYGQLVTDFPSTPEYRASWSMATMHLGHLLRLNGRLEAAEEQYAVAERALLDLLEEYPGFIDYTNRLARVYGSRRALYWSQRQWEAASQAATKFVECWPDNGESYWLRGMVFLCMGRYEDALADLTHASEIDPNAPINVIAWLLAAGPSNLRAPQKAAAMAESRLVDGNERAAILGAAYYRLGHYVRAQWELTRAVQRSDDNQNSDFYTDCLSGAGPLFLAMTCGQLEQHEEAHKWFAQAEAWFDEKVGTEDVHLQSIREEAAAVLASIAAKVVVPKDNGRIDLDPNRNRVLVGQEPSAFEIKIHLSPGLTPAKSQWQGVSITRNGRPLEPGLDYDLRYDPKRQTILLTPATGVFTNGVYRVSIPLARKVGEITRSDVSISVDSRLSTPRKVTLQNGRGGYDSAKYEPHEPIELVPRGAEWRYLDDGSDEGEAWRALDFDDSQWATGLAQLGYGDGDETTVVGFGPDSDNKYATTYFRHRFTVTDPGRIRILRLELLRDDGAAVYLNGEGIVRDNLPTDATYSTYAPTTVDGNSESAYFRHYVISPVVLMGQNCIAAEVHQRSEYSSDVSFDLRLTSPRLASVIFEDVFGEDSRHIPIGATITSAALGVISGDRSSSDLRLTPVVSGSTGLDERDEPLVNNIDNSLAFDVKNTVQAWCDGEPNRGWFLIAGDETRDLGGSQHSPVLSVNYVAPEDLGPLAWHFANCADVELRDSVLALEYGRRAVKSSPQDTNSHAVFGAALFRNGQFEEAIAALEKALALDRGNQRASIILAMANAECGRHVTTREILSQLREGQESGILPERELSRLQGEAERLLNSGLAGPQGNDTESSGR